MKVRANGKTVDGLDQIEMALNFLCSGGCIRHCNVVFVCVSIITYVSWSPKLQKKCLNKG